MGLEIKEKYTNTSKKKRPVKERFQGMLSVLAMRLRLEKTFYRMTQSKVFEVVGGVGKRKPQYWTLVEKQEIYCSLLFPVIFGKIFSRASLQSILFSIVFRSRPCFFISLEVGRMIWSEMRVAFDIWFVTNQWRRKMAFGIPYCSCTFLFTI